MKIRQQLLIAAVFLSVCASVNAQFVWTGSGATGSVTDPNNWQAHVPAVPVGDGTEDLVFGNLVGTQSTVLFPTMAVNNISFTSTVDAYNFSGSGSPVLTINGNISGAVGSDFTFANTLGLSFSAGSHQFDAQASSLVQIDSVLSGNGALVFTGSGTVNITSTNTYAGGTTVDQGGHISLSGSITHSGSDTLIGVTSGTNGELDINAGAHVTDSTGQIAFTDNTTSGTVYVAGAGATWTNIANLNVGVAGSGTLFIQNGGAVNSASTFLGNNAGSTGFVEISAASTMTNSGTLSVGGLGTATFDIIQGSMATDLTGVIAGNAGGQGTVDVNGAGSIWNNTGDLHVGSAGLGLLSIENGGVVNSANGYLATQSTASGDVILLDPGSTWNVGNALYVGYAGNGVLGLYAGGTINVAGGNGTVYLGFGSGSTGSLVIGQGVGQGGIVDAANITSLAGTGAVTFYNNDTVANPYFLTKDGTSTGAPVNITGSTTVFAEDGYTVLGGNNTYTGGTTILAGTLYAASNNALGTGPVTFGAPAATLTLGTGISLNNTLNLAIGGTLAGNGNFNQAVTAGTGVTLSPGTGIGTLGFNSLTLAGGGTLAIDVHLAAGSAGFGYDTVGVSGPFSITATPGSPFTIKVNSLDTLGNPGPVSDFNSASSYSWTVLTAGTIPGFSPADFVVDTSGFSNSLGGGSFFLVQTGNQLELDFSPVPEPSAYALLASGLGLVGWTFWRRRGAQG
jgi:T5SS/PEP-CTERM-associated repeat protein/autotransporter-associated beta strand protein